MIAPEAFEDQALATGYVDAIGNMTHAESCAADELYRTARAQDITLDAAQSDVEMYRQRRDLDGYKRSTARASEAFEIGNNAVRELAGIVRTANTRHTRRHDVLY